MKTTTLPPTWRSTVADERFKYFTRELPTSALIGVQELSHPDLMVEIQVMAVIPRGRKAAKGTDDE